MIARLSVWFCKDRGQGGGEVLWPNVLRQSSLGPNGFERRRQLLLVAQQLSERVSVSPSRANTPTAMGKYSVHL